MNTMPAGTPDDWWEAAEIITTAEEAERHLNCWYITRIRTAGDTKPGYRLSTPSKPPNIDRMLALAQRPVPSERVRCIFRSTESLPSWMTSDYVQADLDEGKEERAIWVRKRTGRWHCLTDGRKNVNDHTMALLHPRPATFTVEDLI